MSTLSSPECMMAAKKRAIEQVTTLTHAVELGASPRQIFELYVDARRHARVIGAPVKFARRIGGRFSAWGGSVAGINVDLREPSLIVQAWRTTDFPKGHYSILRLSLETAGRGRTRLTLSQHGVPRDCAKDIEQNWHQCYWESMQRMFSSDEGEHPNG